MPGLGYRKDWDVLEGYFAFGEAVATPATPAADQVRLYAADNSGETQLCYVNDAGNTVCLPTSGSIPTGSGVANRLTYWATASTLDDVPRTLTAGSVLFVHSDFLPQEDNAKFFWDDTNDKLLIGINSGSHVGTTAKLDVDSDGDDTYVSVASHAASGVKAAALQFTRSLGTHATPSVLGENDYIGRLIFKGYDSNSYESALEVRIETDAAPSDGSMPGRMVILTTPSGSVTPVERVRIDSSGHLHLKSPATAAEFRIYEPSGSGTNYTAFKAQAQAADITYTLPPDDGDADEVLATDGSGNLSWVAAGSGSGATEVDRQVYTSSDTWSKPAGLLFVEVIVMGGGGGGGGVAAATAETIFGAGGGGGGFSRKVIMAAALGSTETVTIGAAGSGGNTSGTDGTAGGNSSFGTNAVGNGGGGGGGGLNSTTAVEPGGTGGTGTSGDVNITGGAGWKGASNNASILGLLNTGGGGGHSVLSPGAQPQQAWTVQDTAGATPAGYGGGGSGGLSHQSGTGAGAAGGAGTAGIIIVTEFIA